MKNHEISLTVNGLTRRGEVEPRLLRVHHLRDGLRVTSPHVCCSWAAANFREPPQKEVRRISLPRTWMSGWLFGPDRGDGDDLVKGGPGSDDPGFVIGPGARGLYGGLGDDRVEGDGGGDFLVGGTGADLLLGGAGDDRIADPGPGASDEIRCGAGEDFVEASPGDLVAADCERVERP